MFNPQQNININISYNLGNEKPTKSITGKKNTKNQKANYTHSTGNCDIQIKLKSKPAQGSKKIVDNKQIADKKGLKKKQVQIGRNTFTPDLFNERRMKTEGPSAELDNSSTIKKQSKSKNVSKSIQPAQQKIGASMKRSGTAKTTKSLKPGHINSFSLLNWKKNPLEFGQHILSQAITSLPKKRKTISQLVNNDKVVTKLLNVSLLASDIGGSRPITSDRGYSSQSSKTFKEYLSSIDMRILRVMQDDVPIFSKRQNSHQEVIKSILKEKSISLQQLTRKVVIIQRIWKKMMKNIIVNKYKLLFQQVTGKLIKQQKDKEKQKSGKQLSNYAAQSFHSQTFNIQDLVKDQLGSAVTFNRQEKFGQVILGGKSINNYQISWIEENQTGFKSSSQVLNGFQANFQQHNPLLGKDKRAQHWNSINKKLSNLMNNKKQFDPTLLLDDFIEQSNYNKQWIENQFQPSSKKTSLLNSEQKAQNLFNGQISCQEGNISQCYLKKQVKQVSEGDEDSLQEQLSQYNRRKYLNQSDKNSRNLQQARSIIKTDLDHNFHQSDEPSGLSHYMLQDKVVKNYLDCGLDDFGLQISKKLLSPDSIYDSYDNSDDQSPVKDDQEQFFIDQAIGKKFQQANRGLIRLNQIQKDQIEPKIGVKFDNKQVQLLVDESLDNLICQFAIDISIILKKSVPVPPVPQKIVYNPNRPIGIQSNFNSVKNYVIKLLAYVEKDENNMKKIIENINKDIGPSSLEILTYLRPQYEEGSMPNIQQQSQQIQEEGLFVIPAELFEKFQTQLEEQYKILNLKQMAPRIKAYSNFWNRCIFEALNEYLDHERPYGIDGKPYDWVTQSKIFRIVTNSNVKKRIESGCNRLYDNIQFVGGIIFEKSDSPFGNAPISDQQKHQINEERLSRILATELLQTESSWINYNDESAQLLVELSRLIQDKIFFEYITQMKKMQRRRRMIIEDFNEEQHVVYNL